MQNTSQTTLKEIAAKSGYSIITVSRVMSGRNVNHVSEKTQSRIKAVAAELNYHPNLLARRLVDRSSNIVGVLIDSQAPQYYYKVLSDLELLADAQGLRLQIGTMHDDLEAIKRYVNDFLGSGISSVICASHTYPDIGAEIVHLMEAFQRVVFLEQPLADTRFSYVTSDHYANHYAAVTRLLTQQKLQRLAVIRANYHDKAYQQTRQAIMDAYEACGRPFSDCLWLEPAVTTLQRGDFLKTVAPQLLEQHCDGILIDNDLQALKLIRELSAHTHSLPYLFTSSLSDYGQVAMPPISGLVYDTEQTSRTIMELLTAPVQESGQAVRIPAKLVFNA